MATYEVPEGETPSHKALIRSWWKKVSAAHPKAHLFKEMKVPVVEHGVFGIPLEKSITYASSNISYIDDHTGEQRFGLIPTIIAKCGSFLKEEGLAVEGIFRLPGNSKRIRLLQSVFDTPDTYGSQLDWFGYSVHDAASIMRRFLNFLPEPVITLNFYDSFKKIIDMPSSDQNKISAFQALIESLPLPNQYLLLYLLDMLALFASASAATRMNSECLASVFVPGILSHPQYAMEPSSYKHSQRVLRFLIDRQEHFFLPRSNMQPPVNANAQVPPSGSKDKPFQETNCDLARTPSQPTSSSSEHRASTIYSLTMGSYSGTGLDNLVSSNESIDGAPTSLGPALRRSKTLPGNRLTYSGLGRHRQVVHVNRNASQSGRRRQDPHSKAIRDQYV
ncbi:Rho GTPase activation protein [Hesseltinella vesiculosa]|uniref:Rho GTPase activation protein n=1 Tax=Hesseltinella vesiculosa TaxID=101127 RepID=A0A1X2GME8_9FUNG|nr:Rho GTPase activation protein [Hesseltinella vesiculosa]